MNICLLVVIVVFCPRWTLIVVFIGSFFKPLRLAHTQSLKPWRCEHRYSCFWFMNGRKYVRSQSDQTYIIAYVINLPVSYFNITTFMSLLNVQVNVGLQAWYNICSYHFTPLWLQTPDEGNPSCQLLIYQSLWTLIAIISAASLQVGLDKICTGCLATCMIKYM